MTDAIYLAVVWYTDGDTLETMPMTTKTKTKTERPSIDGDAGLGLINLNRALSGRPEVSPEEWAARRKGSKASKDSTSAPRVRGAKTPKASTSKAPKDDFARILRAALVKSDQTLYRVSMDTGIGQDVLSRFVREERGLSLETASRLAMHLGYQLKRG